MGEIDIEEEVKELQHQVNEYRQDILDLQGEQDRKNARVEQLEEELEELKETIASRVQQATQQVNKQIETIQQEYQDKYTVFQQESSGYQKSIKEQQSSLQANEAELVQAKDKEQHMHELLQDFQFQIQNLQQQYDALA